MVPKICTGNSCPNGDQPCRSDQTRLGQYCVAAARSGRDSGDREPQRDEPHRGHFAAGGLGLR